MNIPHKRYVLTFFSALLAGAGSLWAQTAPEPDVLRPEENSEADAIVLDPFTVTTEHEGYKADDTLAGGRIRTSLKDTPASLSVITKKLMEDLGVTNATELLVYTTGTEVAGLFGNYSGLGNRGNGIDFGGTVENSRLVNPAGVNRARGLTAMDQTRNYFPSDIPWDGFNISRVDISRGPNSFLFGTGSPSGISNVSTHEATYKDGGEIELRYGSFDSTRQSLDYNKVLINDQLALRVDLVNTNTKFRQKPAFNDSKRVYGALRYDPDFLKTDSARTKIQASFEHGEVKSNNPRILPPVDYITGYLNDSRASATGIDPWMFTQNLTEAGADPNYSLWANAGSVGNQYMWSGTPQFYWDGETGTLLGAGESGIGRGPGATPNTWNVHSTGFNGYARAANRIALQQGIDPTDAPFPGAWAQTVSYLDQTLSDTNIFDFYKQLIDGDNKREWQDWDAYNVSITQSLFNDRLTVQGVVDHQEYSRGFKGVFGNRTPTLMLDLNSHLLTGNPTWLGNATVNPNVGRPLVFADQGKYEDDRIIRDHYQVTASYLLDVERDLKVNGALGRILGTHNFTGLWSQFERFSENRNFKLNGVDSDYLRVTGHNLNARTRDVGFNWLAYMGPSMLGTTGGATLGQLQHPFTLPDMVNFNIYSDEWIAGASVDPADEWTYTGKDGTVTTATQADNPANYRGYIQSPFGIINGDSNPWVLANSGRKAEQIIESKAIMYQGHFWDDTIVPSLGYRIDTTKQRGANADNSGDIVSLDYDIIDPAVSARTESLSYGVAIHLPKAIKKNLPAGTDLTFHYFHGENETPRVRYGMDGRVLPNESGVTDDYSLQFDGLNGRLTARLTYFKTRNENSSAYVGVPLATWLVKGLPAITLQYFGWGASERMLGRNAETGEIIGAPASWDTWRSDPGGPWGWRPHAWMDTQPADWLAHEEAMKTTFVEMFPQEYWDIWGYNVDVEAIKRGDWLHIIPGWDDPYNISKMGGRETINGEFPTLEQNLESKGYELEVTYRPLSNWDITFNGSRVDATQTGFGAAATQFITNMKEVFVDTPVGYGNVWGGFETAKTMFNGDVWSKYLVQTALVGSEQPEMRKYRFNVISNYRIDRGMLKGLNFGGAFRWEDKAILGYGIREDELAGWIPDVDAPIYGPTEEHLDLWVGYQRALTEKIDWRVQLNVRNAFENDRLVTVAVQPDGSTAQARIMSGSTYELTMKLMF